MQDQRKSQATSQISKPSQIRPSKPPTRQEILIHHPEQQQQQLNEPHTTIQDYFKNIKTKNQSKAASSTSIIQMLINQSIQNGEIQLQVAEDGERQSFDKYLIPKKIKTQDEVIDDKKKIQMNLEYLHLQLSRVGEESSQMPQEQISVLSKRKHKQFLQKIWKEKTDLQKTKKKNEESEKLKQQKEEEQRKKAIEEEQEKEKYQRKKKILEKMEEQKQKHQKFLQGDEESNKRLSQIKSNKRLYEKIQQKFQSEVVLPSLEDKKKKLKEIRQMKRAFDASELNSHETEYLKIRQKSLEQSQAKKESDWVYKAPARSSRIVKLLEQEKLQAEQKALEKQKRLQEKLKRQMQFAAYLKERQPPKIDQRKREEIEKRTYKEKIQQPDKKEIGQNYLDYMKKMRKKNSNRQFYRRPLRSQSENKTEKANTNFLFSEGSRKKDLSDLRIKRVDKLIKSDDYDKMEKVWKLQLEVNKLSDQSKRKQQLEKFTNKHSNVESVDLIMASIKAKMGIIDVFNKQ